MNSAVTAKNGAFFLFSGIPSFSVIPQEENPEWKTRPNGLRIRSTLLFAVIDVCQSIPYGASLWLILPGDGSEDLLLPMATVWTCIELPYGSAVFRGVCNVFYIIMYTEKTTSFISLKSDRGISFSTGGFCKKKTGVTPTINIAGGDQRSPPMLLLKGKALCYCV